MSGLDRQPRKGGVSAKSTGAADNAGPEQGGRELFSSPSSRSCGKSYGNRDFQSLPAKAVALVVSFPLLLILVIMSGLLQLSSHWWLLPIIAGVAFAALWWWMRKPVRQTEAVPVEAVGDGQVPPDSLGTAQVLSEFFGAPEPGAAVSAPHMPRLTAHPLAQIIAHARLDPASAARKTEPAVASVPPAAEVPARAAAAPAPQDMARAKDAELAQVRLELAHLTARYKALDKEAFIHSAHNKQLEAEIADLRAGLVPPDAPTQEDIERLKAEVAEAKAQLEAGKSENRTLIDKLRVASAWEVELENARRDLAAAEELLRVAEMPSESPASVPAAPPETPAIDTSVWEKEIESLRSVNEALRAEIACLKANGPAGRPDGLNGSNALGDDLTDIKGIAKVLNRKLNEHGISTFRQIALMTEAEIAELGEALGLKNRITRDQWQAQARRLHAEKHGEVLPERAVAAEMLPLSDLPLEAAGRPEE